MVHNRERRRRPRIATLVMSQVFISTGLSGKFRYFGPAIVMDMSESGLALAMDVVPPNDSAVQVHNKYFRVEAIIRNSSSLEVDFVLAQSSRVHSNGSSAVRSCCHHRPPRLFIGIGKWVNREH